MSHSEKKPHVHAELIKAWADGAQIQIKLHFWKGPPYWANIDNPTWMPGYEYRIKPEPKPDIQIERKIYLQAGVYLGLDNGNPNIRFVFDGETKKLKSVTMI